MQERASHKAILQPQETKSENPPLFSFYYPETNSYVDAPTQEEADRIHRENNR